LDTCLCEPLCLLYLYVILIPVPAVVPFYRWAEPRAREVRSSLNMGMVPKPEFFLAV
jgi:hypothetical protein